MGNSYVTNSGHHFFTNGDASNADWGWINGIDNGDHDHSGGEHVHAWDNIPKHYVLAFIIKVE